MLETKQINLECGTEGKKKNNCLNSPSMLWEKNKSNPKKKKKQDKKLWSNSPWELPLALSPLSGNYEGA